MSRKYLVNGERFKTARIESDVSSSKFKHLEERSSFQIDEDELNEVARLYGKPTIYFNSNDAKIKIEE